VPDADDSAPPAPGLLSQAAWTVSRTLASIAIFGLLLLAAATTVDVLMRYGFAKPLRGFVDIASLAGAVLLAACFPYVLCARTNIAIDALGGCLGPRAKRALDRFAAIVSGVFFAVLAWQYIAFAAGLQTDGQTLPVLGWVVWPWWAAVAVFVLLAAVAALLTAWRHPQEARS